MKGTQVAGGQEKLFRRKIKVFLFSADHSIATKEHEEPG